MHQIRSKISHDRFRPTIELLQCISLELRLYDRATERTVVMIMKVPRDREERCSQEERERGVLSHVS